MSFSMDFIGRKTVRSHSLDSKTWKSQFDRSPKRKKHEFNMNLRISPTKTLSQPSLLFSKTISFRLISPHSTNVCKLTNRESSPACLYQNKKLEEKIKDLVPAPRLCVDLSNCSLIDRDIPTIVNEIVQNRKCNELWLYKNHLTSYGASLMALGMARNYTLTILDLSMNPLSNLGIWTLTQVLKINGYCSLKILFLSQTGITNASAYYLADMLKTNESLTELWLSDNDIGSEGVRCLAEVLKENNRTLKLLSLSRNATIDDTVIDSLLSIFKKNSTFNKCWMNDCNLTLPGKERLRTIVNKDEKNKIEL